MPRISRKLSSKPVGDTVADLAVVLNREVMPVLREIRDALNANNTLRSGDGAPDASLGDDGDLYVDTTAAVIYKKAAGAWS